MSRPTIRRSTIPALVSALLAGTALCALTSPAAAATTTPSTRTDFAKLHAVSASSATDAWAVGFRQQPGQHSLGLTRHWDGTRWRTVESVHPLDYSYVWGVEDLSPTDAWAVGETLGGAMILPFVEHWDGSHWSEVAVSNRPGMAKLTAVSANAPDDVWMVGTRYDNTFQLPRAFIAHWDGHRIRVVHPGQLDRARNVEFTSISAIAPDDVWAVGAHGRHSQTYLPLVEHFDGDSWSVVPGDPAQGSSANLGGVDGSSATDAWSVGWTVRPGDEFISAFAQHWDGSRWTESQFPTPGFASYLTSVSEVAPDDVWAVGTWAKALPQRTDRPLVMHWDGATWSVVAAPKGDHAATNIESVSMVGEAAGFAVGEKTASGQTTPYSIRWDGAAWYR